MSKHLTMHVLGHGYATHMLEAGVDIRTVLELLSYSHLDTTMIYSHVMVKPGVGVPVRWITCRGEGIIGPGFLSYL